MDVFLAVPCVVGTNILGVFLAVPRVVGENIYATLRLFTPQHIQTADLASLGPRFGWRRRKLETTVYLFKLARHGPKLRQTPFQTIPDISFFDRQLFFVRFFLGRFLTFWDLYSSGTLRKRSGTLRNHPETFCNDLKCLEFTENDLISSKNHSKTSKKHTKVIHG